jgi:hypothetical protein
MSSADIDVGREPSREDDRRFEDERSYRDERRASDWLDARNRDPQTIERELDATRADLRDTLTALERRLSFDRLFDLTVGRIREHGGQFAGNLGHAAVQNPMPVLLTSIGLGWMMLESRRGNGAYGDGESSSTDRMSGRMGRMGDRMHHAMDSSRERMARARDSLHGATDSMRSGASHAAAATRERAEQARASFEHMLEEQPLVLGAIGLAAGAFIGALLPASEAENRWLGDTRERALRSAARAAREHAREGAGRDEGEAAPEFSAQANRDAGGAATGATERPTRPH